MWVMKILGFNMAHNSYGLPLDNGGACLIVDGEVKMLINEERLTRKQYDAGIVRSIKYVLDNNDLVPEDIDLFVASSCLDVEATPEAVQAQLKTHGFDVPRSKIIVCNHHLSHASSAFYPSGFDKAIVMVLDGDGNALTNSLAPGTGNAESYWHNHFQHNSYYLGEGRELRLIERDDVRAGENGFGGVYRYFTYFCGFPGYKYAGKLMGLSAYGAKRNRYKDVQIFDLQPEGQVKCLVPDADRLNSPKVVEDWLAKNSIHIKARDPKAPITEDIEDIAWLMQRDLDRALIHKVKYLVKKTGVRKLCIAGGVGLNAVTNRALLDYAGIEAIYIQPAAGDSGQCLGDALHGLYAFDTAHALTHPVSVYQGKEYSSEEIETVLAGNDAINFTKLPFARIAQGAAQDIAAGKIIAWFQGRSEMGPRALGNRSIIADPRRADMKDTINERVKHRESFRPFAPSVLAEKAPEWFDLSVPAPYMILNALVTQPSLIPAVTHVDGSARVQTVDAHDNSRYHALITAFYETTGVPVVLNTSFNDNEAIVESPCNALSTFLRTNIDVLYIGDYRVEKI